MWFFCIIFIQIKGMNIFVLDLNAEKCAQYHCNKHIVKMIVEYNQILGSIAYTARGINRKKDITPGFVAKTFQGFPRLDADGNISPYGIGYTNHPCTTWAKSSRLNYMWLCSLNLEMCKEYTFRYKKVHSGEKITNWYLSNCPELPNIPMTPFAQAMPEAYKDPNDVVKAYKQYYINDKAKFAKWPIDRVPEWWPYQNNEITCIT